ncbi:MAG TPA: hypothetical protein VK063_06735 [Beutenbergiaceae bacterium]|nr:hypothetical protein [Beutenbergiaceae bacterium]
MLQGVLAFFFQFVRGLAQLRQLPDQNAALFFGGPLDLFRFGPRLLGLSLTLAEILGRLRLLLHRLFRPQVHQGGNDLGGFQALEGVIGPASQAFEGRGAVEHVAHPIGGNEHLQVPQAGVVAVSRRGESGDFLAGGKNLGIGALSIGRSRFCFGFRLLQVHGGLVVQVGGDRGVLLCHFHVRGVGRQLHLEVGDLSGGVINALPGPFDLLLARRLRRGDRRTDAGAAGEQERGDDGNTST